MRRNKYGLIGFHIDELFACLLCTLRHTVHDILDSNWNGMDWDGLVSASVSLSGSSHQKGEQEKMLVALCFIFHLLTIHTYLLIYLAAHLVYKEGSVYTHISQRQHHFTILRPLLLWVFVLQGRQMG